MRFARVPVIVSIVLATALVACGDTKRSSGVGGQGFTPSAAMGRPCTSGQKRECSIELGRIGSVIDCAVGEQTCGADGKWSACVGAGTTYKAVAPPPSSGGPADDLHTNSVGGSSTSCTDNPCNPYCRSFDDIPDGGITADSSSSSSSGATTVSLESSNVPGGFQDKGSLEGQCAGPPTSMAYLEACQFDRRCGTKPDGSTGCVPFATGASDGCSALGGVDLTAPVVCVPEDASVYRNLTICNRGSLDLRKDIICMSYPGNSPHFPDPSPGAGIVVLDSARTVDPTTATANPITPSNPLRAGECRTFRVPSNVFQSNGTESIMCNPPATTVPVTTTVFSYALTAETLDFANPDWGRLAGDGSASATTTFAHAAVSPIVYASGTANSSGFASAANLTAAPDGAGAVTTLTAALSSLSNPTNVNNSSGTWTPSTTMTADLASAGDGTSLSRTMIADETASVVATGFTAPGVTGALTGLQLTIESTNSDPSLATGRVWVQRGSDGAWLYAGTLTPGSVVVDVPLPYGALTAADLGSLKVYLGATAGTFASPTPAPVVSFGHLGVRTKYFDPPFASVDATGFAWAAPPAGAYDGLELTATWRASLATGAVVYAFVKKLDGTTVASATLTPPSAYVAGSWTTSTKLVAATGLTAGDLTAGLRVTVQAYPTSGGTIEIDSVGVRPSYAVGTNSRTMRFRDFGIAVPSGATNVKLTTYASYKLDSALSGDWIAAAAYSVSGSTTTLISTRSATVTTNAFRTYQLGAQTIADPRSIEDPRLFVDLFAGRGATPSLVDRIGSVDFLMVRLEYDAIVPTSVDECNPHNNWTVSKTNPATLCGASSTIAYPPWTVSRVFDAACPVGTRPNWKYMGYTSTTPEGASIEFRFRTFAKISSGSCPTLAAITSGSPAPLATARSVPDTQVCSLTAPSASCPVDLESGLGAIAAQNDCLQMDAHGVPSSSPPSSPTLTDWRVTYDCLPRE